MSHTPFIWSAYGITAAILLWTAFAPLIRLSGLKRQLQLISDQERSDDPHS